METVLRISRSTNNKYIVKKLVKEGGFMQQAEYETNICDNTAELARYIEKVI